MNTSFNSFQMRLAAFGLAGAALIAGAVLTLTEVGQPGARAADVTVPLQESSVPRDGLPRGSFAPIVEKVSPAVVKIEVTSSAKDASMDQTPDLNDPNLRQFF